LFLGKDLSVPSSSSSSSVTTKNPIDSIESTAPPPTPLPPSLPLSSTHTFPYDNKTDDHRHKRIKIDNDNDQQNYSSFNNNFPYKSSTTVNLMQPPPPQPPQTTIGHPVGHYISQQNPQILHRQPTPTNNYGRISYPNSISPTHPTYLNSDIKISMNVLILICFLFRW